MEDRTRRDFKPTPEWMKEKYDELNHLYFEGELGNCDFGLFTTGKGSRGRVLGWFKITGYGIKGKSYTRQMFKKTWDGDIYITRNNFAELCKPRIELNGNYVGTEFAFTCTLIHEMCHYENYMWGYIPKQGHGREFRETIALVNSRSNGIYSIQRIANAEQMSEMELQGKAKDLQDKKDKRTKAVLVFMKNGQIRLIRTTQDNLVRLIELRSKNNNCIKVIMINDPEFIRFLSNKGFTQNMTSYRYWSIQDMDWLPEIYKYKQETLWANPDYAENKEETKPQNPEPVTKQPEKIFVIRTKDGEWKTPFNGNYEELTGKIRQRFPKIPDYNIEKLIYNSANYRNAMKENKTDIDKIVENVIKKIKKEKENNFSITPDMNLGLYSPLEIEGDWQ